MISRARRLGAAALFVGAASAVLALAGPDALLPFESLARAAGAEATVSVAFIVDFGSGQPVVACVKVPSSTNGYQALAAFTAQEQEQAPTYAPSGLLCSINGDPGSGCGQVVSGGYAYWSYWHGTSGAWQYASTGAFSAVQDGDVEGWRFEAAGKANPSDPPPGALPDYAAICGAMTTPTTTANAPTASAASTVPAATAPASGASSAPPSSVPADARPPTSPGPGSSGSPPTTAPGPASHAGPAVSTTRPGSNGNAQSLRASDAAIGRKASGNGALPLAIGGGLVAVLAGLAFWRWRRRPRTP